MVKTVWTKLVETKLNRSLYYGTSQCPEFANGHCGPQERGYSHTAFTAKTALSENKQQQERSHYFVSVCVCVCVCVCV
jgi:hypothetical protein